LPARRDPLIRPLLDCWRADTEAYCAQHDLSPRRDASNQDPKYLRNRLRLELLPLLERDYAPGVKEALRRTAELAEAIGSYIQQRGAEELSKIAHPWPPEGMEIEVEGLRSQPVALQWQILREMVRAVQGNLEEVTYSHIEALRQQALQPHGSHQVVLPGGWVARQEYDRLRFGPAGREAEAPVEGRGARWPLRLPGITELPEWGLAFHVTRQRPPESYARLSGHCACLDADPCAEGLWVRTWQEGDRMRPLGLGGTKLLQDIFTDRKVPRRQRSAWPLVVTADRIAWVVGYTIDESFRVTEKTQEVWYLEVQPLV
jgi:tRNA(Ile)-lysidine synthase